MMEYLKAIVYTMTVVVVFLMVMGVVSIMDGQPDTECARLVRMVCGK